VALIAEEFCVDLFFRIRIFRKRFFYAQGLPPLGVIPDEGTMKAAVVRLCVLPDGAGKISAACQVFVGLLSHVGYG